MSTHSDLQIHPKDSRCLAGDANTINIHSSIVIHWTGNNRAGENLENISDINERQKAYVERLRGFYDKGLYLKRTTEESIRIKGRNSAGKQTVIKKKIHNLLRICFTEIRLSHAQEHATRYGKLGIGFGRKFILDNGGRPVIYIPNKAERFPLEQSIWDLWETLQNDAMLRVPTKYLLTFVKPMSGGKENRDNYYDEMEWRLVYDETEGNECFKPQGKGIWRFPFAAKEVKIIIFPDEDTKKMAENDPDIKKCFAKNKHMPSLVTLDDCRNF